MKKQVGIWLDYREALVVRLEDADATLARIESEIEDFHVAGGARTPGTPWGPMDKVSESGYLERRNQQEQRFYKRIMEAVKEADELYIFGPAEAKLGLEKAIEASTTFSPKVLAVEVADSMTQNQVVAQVRSFFKAIGNEN